MYLIETGFGEVFKPRPRPPAKPPPKAPAQSPPPQDEWVVKNGHRRFCPRVGTTERHMGYDLELKIKFRRSFGDFLREIENAYGTWTTDRGADLNGKIAANSTAAAPDHAEEAVR